MSSDELIVVEVLRALIPKLTRPDAEPLPALTIGNDYNGIL